MYKVVQGSMSLMQEIPFMVAASAGKASAQVVAREMDLRFPAEGVDVLHYDQGTHLLLVIVKDRISIFAVDRPSEPPQVCQTAL
jgi:hypothetical protein